MTLLPDRVERSPPSPRPVRLLVAAKAVDAAGRAFRLLQPGWTLAVTAALLGLAALAWWLTWRQTGAMTMGGVRQPAAALFLPMWVTMMVAMMFPAVAPVVLSHLAVVVPRGGGLSSTAALVGGYLAIWTVAGLLPLAVIIACPLIMSEAAGPTVSIVGGLIILVAGLYQFTGRKHACLTACVHPYEFVVAHDFDKGAGGGLRTGLLYGLYCLGCCWALMTVLVLVGLMDLRWMAAVSVIILAERTWRYGAYLSFVAGMLMAELGIAVMVSGVQLLSHLGDGLLTALATSPCGA